MPDPDPLKHPPSFLRAVPLVRAARPSSPPPSFRPPPRCSSHPGYHPPCLFAYLCHVWATWSGSGPAVSSPWTWSGSVPCCAPWTGLVYAPWIWIALCVPKINEQL